MPPKVRFSLQFCDTPAKGNHINFPPNWTEAKPKRATGDMLPAFLRLGGRATGQACTVGFSRLGTQSRDQSFPLGLAWVPRSQDHPRSTCQETLKHTKPHYWEACRQIINLLGTIKAFSYFWLQMLVTRTCTQTPFFSPSSFSPGSLFQETNFLSLGIPGRSGDGTGGRERNIGL